jgi:hypothetical protein
VYICSTCAGNVIRDMVGHVDEDTVRRGAREPGEASAGA